tara:strand:+ start:253 stop:528 length:276 start_codon:yes stop_codon:yes gene_type:complete
MSERNTSEKAKGGGWFCHQHFERLGDRLMQKFEMLDLFLIAMLMVGIFFGLAMLSLHGVGSMTWLSWTLFGCSAWCLVVGWGIVAYNLEKK